MSRIFCKLTKELLPKIRDRYPFIYLEKGRLEIDDSSVKWIDCDCNVVPLPIATISALFLGPGTSITHAAVKALSEANCYACWVGEDSLLYYASGVSPTSNTRNYQKQIKLFSDNNLRTEVARRMFKKRFPNDDLSNKSIHEMMGMEGARVRRMYKQKAEQYGVLWEGRDYVPGNINLSNSPNKILTICNSALYGLVGAVIHSMGVSPYIGFIHSGSPLPFVYDISDLYKEEVSVDLAFSLSKDQDYSKSVIMNSFCQRIIDNDVLYRITKDISEILEISNDSSDS